MKLVDFCRGQPSFAGQSLPGENDSAEEDFSVFS
jgi:hypothetical protein